MTRLLATVTDHARRAITALLEHVDAAWDCWGVAEETQEAAVAPPGVEVGPGSTDDVEGPQIGVHAIDTRETR